MWHAAIDKTSAHGRRRRRAKKRKKKKNCYIYWAQFNGSQFFFFTIIISVNRWAHAVLFLMKFHIPQYILPIHWAAICRFDFVSSAIGWYCTHNAQRTTHIITIIIYSCLKLSVRINRPRTSAQKTIAIYIGLCRRAVITAAAAAADSATALCI